MVGGLGLIIKGLAYVNQGLVRATIFIDEYSGRIKDVKVGYSVSTYGEEVLDFSSGKYLILPGFIDVHTHLRDLNYSYKEDYLTGTSAAAAGGVVVVCDMPNTDPPTNTLSNLMLKLEVAKSKALVDYCIYYGLPKEVSGLNEVIKYVVGFKLYPNDLFVNTDLGVLKEVIKVSASNDLLIVIHAEHPKYFLSNAPPGMERPKEAELRGIEEALGLINSLAEDVGKLVRVHVTHVSTTEAISLINELRRKYSRTIEVTLDITPHHLLLNRNYYGLSAGLHKVYPTLKDPYDNLGLYRALINGYVDAIATDHAPHSIEEKLRPYKEALPGYPGLETVVPLLLTLVDKGLLTIDELIKYYSYGSAKLLGLGNVLGRLSRGYYASLVVIDLGSELIIDPSKFFSKGKYSPFKGWLVKGRPYLTMVRGKVVYEYGEVLTNLRGWGCNVRGFK